MGLPKFYALGIGRKNAIALFRMVDHFTGQLCNGFRNKPGISGGKTGKKIDGFYIDLIGGVDELRLAGCSFLLQNRHWFTPFRAILISIAQKRENANFQKLRRALTRPNYFAIFTPAVPPPQGGGMGPG